MKIISNIRFEKTCPDYWSVMAIPYDAKEIYLPGSIEFVPVMQLATYACACCMVELIEVPPSVSKIETKAFWNCDNLNQIWFKGTPNFHRDSFVNCPNLEAIYFSENIMTMHRTVLEFLRDNKIVLKCYKGSNIEELADLGCLVEVF